MSESSAATLENFAILGASISIIKGKKPSVIYPNPLNSESRPYILIESFGRSYRQYTDDSSCKLAYEEDVLIVWDGERAGLTSHGHSGYIGSTLAAIRITDKSLVSKYLLYILEKERAQLRGSSEGTGVPHLSRWAVENINYFKPSEPEQTKIATVLSSVDDVIEKTRAQIDRLKDLKAGMMQELLTKGIGHTEFKDSAIGRIPSAWNVAELADLVQKDRPITYGIVQTGPHISGGIPCVRVVDLMQRELSDKQMIRTSPAVSQQYKRTVLREGDIMFALRGEIGHVRMATGSLVGANLTRGVGLISPNQKINSHFLLWALRSPIVRKTILDGVNGSALQEIPLSNLRNVLVPVPTQKEQHKIALIMTSINNKLEKIESKFKALANQKKALMQDLLTGKVRVKPDSPEVAAA